MQIQKRPADGTLDEQRLTLYLPAFVLDWAEQQASRAGVSTVQLYCAGLLRSAIEDQLERSPWVAEARVATDFPHGASIEIRERVPIATYAGSDGRFRIIDVEGRVVAVEFWTYG